MRGVGGVWLAVSAQGNSPLYLHQSSMWAVMTVTSTRHKAELVTKKNKKLQAILGFHRVMREESRSWHCEGFHYFLLKHLPHHVHF